MAVSRRTVAAVRDARAAVNGPVDKALATIAQSWGQAWQDIADEWAATIVAMLDLGEGQWPTPTQVRQAQAATNALKVTSDALRDLTVGAAAVAIAALPELVEAAEAGQQAIARAQLPTTHQQHLTWEQPARREVSAIVSRATQRIHSLTRPLTREAESQMKATLVRGVAVGENPRKAAARMLTRTQGVFNGGRVRAETVATTEMLDAHRYAAQASRKANADVLDGWIWLATLDKRTCPACLAMNGSKHSTGDFGPNGHQRCRCTSVPNVRSWRSLGIDLDEPDQSFPDAREWFASQPRAAREQIMGKRRLADLEAGRINWDYMHVTKHNPNWRDSIHVRALPPN